jgi:hypothetical protein
LAENWFGRLVLTHSAHTTPLPPYSNQDFEAVTRMKRQASGFSGGQVHEQKVLLADSRRQDAALFDELNM